MSMIICININTYIYTYMYNVHIYIYSFSLRMTLSLFRSVRDHVVLFPPPKTRPPQYNQKPESRFLKHETRILMPET